MNRSNSDNSLVEVVDGQVGSNRKSESELSVSCMLDSKLRRRKKTQRVYTTKSIVDVSDSDTHAT